MNLIIVVLLLCFVIFLFSMYLLAKEDFVILRSDMSMEKIFNTCMVAAIFALFFSRVFYVLGNPSPVFYSPLGFLLFTYFPGLSLAGGLLGGFTFIYFDSRKKNLPYERLLDFFSASFIVCFPVGLIGFFLLRGAVNSYFFWISLILSMLYAFVFLGFLLRRSIGSKLKDGNFFFLFSATFSLLYIIVRILISKFHFQADLEYILSSGVFLFFTVLSLQRFGFLTKLVNKWKNLQ